MVILMVPVTGVKCRLGFCTEKNKIYSRLQKICASLYILSHLQLLTMCFNDAYDAGHEIHLSSSKWKT